MFGCTCVNAMYFFRVLQTPSLLHFDAVPRLSSGSRSVLVWCAVCPVVNRAESVGTTSWAATLFSSVYFRITAVWPFSYQLGAGSFSLFRLVFPILDLPAFLA